MESWTKLARIVKVTKNLDFVADFVTKSFFASSGLQNLCGQCVCIVPPINDVCRYVIINSVSKQQNHIVFTFDEVFKCEYSGFDLSQFAGKYLLIKQADLDNAFDDLPYLELMCERVVNLDVFDKQLGFIGKVVNIEGGQAQKHLVVKYQAKEILIPYVENIVLSIDNVINVDLPAGLTTI